MADIEKDLLKLMRLFKNVHSYKVLHRIFHSHLNVLLTPKFCYPILPYRHTLKYDMHAAVTSNSPFLLKINQ